MALEGLIEGIPLTVIYTFVSGVSGIILLLLATYLVSRIVDRLTPAIDDQNEILRGNIAVATYIGNITQGVIIGLSIVVAASIIAGAM